jgi:hypothetical protein
MIENRDNLEAKEACGLEPIQEIERESFQTEKPYSTKEIKKTEV